MRAPGDIEIGSEQHLTIVFTDDAGDPIDPTTVVFRTRSPCGVENRYVYGTDDEVGKSQVGYYFADITPDEAGRWIIRWETTGPTFAKADGFTVQASAFSDLTGFADYI